MIFVYIWHTQDEVEPGLLEQVKSQICDNVAMYAQKYDEEFSPHLATFVTAVWNLLINTGHQVKYDLVSECLLLLWLQCPLLRRHQQVEKKIY